MKTLHIALCEDATGGDADYERIKAACEDAVCTADDVHHPSCLKLRGHVQIGAATRSEPHPRSFDSASPTRTVNNLMRHTYRQLDENEKEQMRRVKDLGLELVALLHNIGGTLTDFHKQGGDTRQASRELSIAQTKAEEAVMWAVKHVTG